jgi:hypothetical protein
MLIGVSWIVEDRFSAVTTISSVVVVPVVAEAALSAVCPRADETASAENKVTSGTDLRDFKAAPSLREKIRYRPIIKWHRSVLIQAARGVIFARLFSQTECVAGAKRARITMAFVCSSCLTG